MSDSDFQEVLTLTLRKIGRNLLNYQLVERQWRSHIKFSSISSDLETGTVIYSNAVKNSLPMGYLEKAYVKSIFGESDERDEPSNEHLSIRTSFKIEVDKKIRRKQLSTLVKERNALVHGLPNRFNHSDQESCIQLCKQLDEENIRILAELEYLNNISVGFKEVIIEIQKYLLSDEFINDLNKH